MTLRLLAGPFPMKSPDGVPLYLPNSNTEIFTWVDEFESILAAPSQKLEYGVLRPNWPGALVQLDGTVCRRNSQLAPYTRFQFDFGLNKLACGVERDVDWWSLRPRLTDEPYMQASVPIHYTTFSGGWTYTADRMLLAYAGVSPSSPVGLWAIDYETLAPTLEQATFPTTPDTGVSDGMPKWHLATGIRAQPGRRSMFFISHNAAVEYDYSAKQFIGWPRVLDPGPIVDGQYRRLVGFASKLGVWLAVDRVEIGHLHWQDRLWIYADQAVPHTITNPVLLPEDAANMKLGYAARYRVRVTGSFGEPCVGVPVRWSCTAPGIVMQQGTPTDENGWAETKIAFGFPGNSAPMVGMTLSAEVDI